MAFKNPTPSVVRRLFQRLLGPLLKRWARWSSQKRRNYRYENLKLEVFPSVFHPGWFISTTVLLRFLATEKTLWQTQPPLRFLELGAGSGAVAVWAALHTPASVYASDINPTAIENVRYNAIQNNAKLPEIWLSDLFEQIPIQYQFDYIIINPPYYPKQPQNFTEQAFFCGENFEYFHRLFSQLPARLSPKARAIMILSEDCQLATIEQIALSHRCALSLRKQYTHWNEVNYIIDILPC